MAKKIPDTETTPAVFTGQLAFIQNPSDLLEKSPAELRRYALQLAQEARPAMAEIRRYVGLICWAMRSKVPQGEYTAWVDAYAVELGVSVRTLYDWRTGAEKKAGIDSPYSAPRQGKSAGQAGRLAELQKPIPAASTEAPKLPERPVVGPTPPPVPSGPTSAGGGPSSGTTPPPAGPNATVAAPTIRAQLAHLFDHLADLDPAEAWEAMTTDQRELFRQWADIMRQATTVPPRVRTTPVALSRPVPLDRHEVTPMFKKGR
jgi:hypothetical protein